MDTRLTLPLTKLMESRSDSLFLISVKLCFQRKSVRDEPEPCNQRNLVKSCVKLKRVPLGLGGARMGGLCGSSISGNYHRLLGCSSEADVGEGRRTPSKMLNLFSSVLIK